MKPYIVCVFNQKGGVHVTEVVTNLAVCLASAGKSVVVLDLHSDGLSTKRLGVKPHGGRGIYEVLTGSAELSEVILPSAFKGVSVVQSSYRLAGIELVLSTLKDSHRTLKRRMEKWPLDSDYVIIDCPPALGILPINCLAAADAVIVPMSATPYADDGLQRTLPSLKYVQEGLNKQMLLLGVLFTPVDSGKPNKEVMRKVRNRLGGTVHRAEIPRDKKESEATAAGLPVCAYAPSSPAAQAYLDFTFEFMDRHAKIAAKEGLPIPQPPSRDAAVASLMRCKENGSVRSDETVNNQLRQLGAQLDRIAQAVASGTIPRFGSADEVEQRQIITARLDRLLNELERLRSVNIGHNNPPESIEEALTGKDLADLEGAALDLRASLDAEKPDISRIIKQTKVFRLIITNILQWLGKKLDISIDAFMKKCGERSVDAFGFILLLHIIGIYGDAAALLVDAYEHIVAWLQSVTTTF